MMVMGTMAGGRASLRRKGEVLAFRPMGLSPCIFEHGGVEVAAVVPGDHAPEVEAVSVVDAVQTSHVDATGLPVFGEVETFDVLRDKAQGFGLLDCGGRERGRGGRSG